MAKTLSNTAGHIRDRVEVLAAQWINGNRKDVLKEIATYTANRAAYTITALDRLLTASDMDVIMRQLLEAAVEEIGPSDTTDTL